MERPVSPVEAGIIGTRAESGLQLSRVDCSGSRPLTQAQVLQIAEAIAADTAQPGKLIGKFDVEMPKPYMLTIMWVVGEQDSVERKFQKAIFQQVRDEIAETLSHSGLGVKDMRQIYDRSEYRLGKSKTWKVGPVALASGFILRGVRRR